ncbi:MAG TPA: hypothetical protein VGJ32_02900, partial [Solirubrobacteraceae bacterium]
DAGAMARRLAGALRATRVSAVSVRRVFYRPGRRISVRYAAPTADGTGPPQELVAVADAGRDLEALVERTLAARRARLPGDLGYDPELRVMVARAPADPWMPVLAREDRLRDCARAGGATVADDDVSLLLHFKPGEQAVVRLGACVLKAYARPAAFEAASSALRLMSTQRDVPTAQHLASIRAERVTVQELLPGVEPLDALAVAPPAGELLRRLHGLELAPARDLPAAHLVRRAARSGDLLATLVPSLAKRFNRLLGRLRDTLPDAVPVPAHGGYHHRQLLVDGDRASVIDVDGLCLAAPAFDLATYAAGAITGGDDDVAGAHALLDALLAGYGEPPAVLGWHLAVLALARTTQPFRHFSGDDYPERIERFLGTAEALVELQASPLSRSSRSAPSRLGKSARSMPRSTGGALVNWTSP